jgi:hypothetical protein
MVESFDSNRSTLGVQGIVMTLPPDTLFPNRAQSQMWSRARKSVNDLHSYTQGVELLVSNLADAANFASENGLDSSELESLNRPYYKLKTNIDNLFAAMNAVEDRELLIRPNGSDDFDILAPPDEGDAIERYSVDVNNLGFPFIFLGAAIVVVSTVVITIAVLWKQAKSIKHEAEIMMRKAESRFCKDPNSTTCRRWQDNEGKQVAQKRGLVDDILGAIGLSGTNLGIGAVIGLGIGIYLLTRNKKS